jgi:predicted alpha/beta-fold hydrolase
MTTRDDDFRPHPLLASPHVQTTWGRALRARRAVRLVREAFVLPDGDEVLLDHLEVGAPATPGAPHVLLLHGLKGSSHSVYIQGLLRLLAARRAVDAPGLAATVLNFRSCARPLEAPGSPALPNRGARLYHSGETGDLECVIDALVARRGGAPIRLIGVSLGGNVVLKWLGEHPGDPRVARAATMSVPYDLEAGARHLERGVGPLYANVFIESLKEKARAVAARSPEAAARIDLPRALASRTFFDYDDAATAPLHGFAGARDYYARSSSLGFLGRIATPTLVVSALDDPFLPPSVPAAVRQAASAAVATLFTARGGHAGFVAGPPWRARYWAEERLVEWVLGRDDSGGGGTGVW